MTKKNIRNGNKTFEAHMRMGQETMDILNGIKEKYGLSRSQAVRWALQNADFDSDNGDGDAAQHACSGSAGKSSYSQEDMVVMKAEVKVLAGLKRELHRLGSNLNQIAHHMNSARMEGSMAVRQKDVDAIMTLHDGIKESYGQICPIIENIKARCGMQ